jgi:hypothetical protein
MWMCLSKAFMLDQEENKDGTTLKMYRRYGRKAGGASLENFKPYVLTYLMICGRMEPASIIRHPGIDRVIGLKFKKHIPQNIFLENGQAPHGCMWNTKTSRIKHS